MADTKFAEPEQDDAPEGLWTLTKQLRIRDLVNAIKQIVFDDFQHLANVARGRPLDLETFTLLCKEFVKTRTGCAILIVVAVVVCIILLVYSMEIAAPFLVALGFTNVGPAAGKTLGLRSSFERSTNVSPQDPSPLLLSRLGVSVRFSALCRAPLWLATKFLSSLPLFKQVLLLAPSSLPTRCGT
jgi:hypothetical protein